MKRLTTSVRTAALLGVGLVTSVAVGFAAPGTASAAPSPHALIQGTGSSWSANAVNQWISDVTSTGLQVVFTGSGSAQGRKDFANRTTDFAVSDIGYQGHDAITGEDDTNCIPGNPCRNFAYEPIVAGGTSFPYQIKVAGKLVRNLRLSGETLAKIFTYKITNWNDAQVTADNNGHKLPSIPIVPVVHSEGSGSTAQFTTFLDNRYPNIWRPFAHGTGFTEYYPPPKGGHGIAQSGSDGVMNFVSSQAANGAIGYDEYSYPLAKGYPVAKILNQAGYYTLPDQYNVAVALQHAKINTDKNSPNYLLQDLRNVFVAPEVQAYPLSSYSYFLIPTASNDTRMTTAKRQTLADYLYFSVCQGQKEMGPIGYSPLPINLVQASFDQTAKLKTADPKVDLNRRNVTTCQNPTFVAGHPEINHLAKIAPAPAACDKKGQGPCNANGSPSVSNGGGTGGGSGGSGGGSGGSGGSSGGTGGSGGGSAGGAAKTSKSATASATPSGNTSIDPVTGEVITNGGAGGDGSNAEPVPAELAAYRQQSLSKVLAPLAVVELLAVLLLPPAVYYLGLRRHRKRT
jgi:phosphate transport system substrate-binding protein